MNIDVALIGMLGAIVGGVIVAACNYFFISKSETKKRKIKFLNKQTRELYGPLHYFILQAKILLDLNKRFSDAGRKEFRDREYSRDENTQTFLNENSNKTIDFGNNYIFKIKQNNQKIKELLDQNYALIDPDDIDVFSSFTEHYIRMGEEVDENGRLKTPQMIYPHIGDISYIPQIFITRIDEKFLKKRKELEVLNSTFWK